MMEAKTVGDEYLSPDEVQRLEEAYKAGMKKVVEWVMANAQKAVISSGQEWTYELEDDFMKGKEFDYYLVHIYPESLQAKLTEWGIQ